MLYKKGSKSAMVKTIQNTLGIYADGVYGETTELAVKRFQTKNNLVVNGVVDDVTFKLLFPDTSTPKLITTDSSVDYHNLDIPDNLKDQANKLITLFKDDITDHFKLAHFLAQTDHESQGFTHMRENLNYSAKGLCNIFPSHFHNLAKAKEYERQPERIANHVYCNINGNGNEASGDGWKYRGGGALGSTGKCQYEAITEFINNPNVDLVKNPELIETEYSLISAALFFTNNKIWRLCKTANMTDVKAVTRIINPALVDLQKRYQLTIKYNNLLR